MFLHVSTMFHGYLWVYSSFFGGDVSERSSLLMFFLLDDGLASVEDD